MNWLSVAEIAKTTRIPAPTARRYASLFREFLPTKKVGRVTKYAEDSISIFQRISQLYADGHVTHEIEDILKSECSRTIDVDTGPAPVAGFGNLDMIQSFHDLMDKFGSCLEIIANQKSMIEQQREDIQKLKTAFVLLSRSQKRVKQLPGEAFTKITTDLTHRTRKLEAKDTELEELTLGLSYDNSDMKAKMQILESELVRLRKDRREMEQFFRDKFERVAKFK